MKKQLVASLAAAMVLGVAGTSFAAANPFVDVPAKHWAYESVTKLAQAGIVDGYGDGKFQGDKMISRYEMAQIVAKAMAKSDKADAAQKAAIDKLSVEFASELEGLNVRVTKLEKNSSSIKVTGEARLRYDATSVEDAAHVDALKLRTRIHLNGNINDQWTYYGRLEAVNNMRGDKETVDTSTAMDNAFVQGPVFGATATIGRFDYMPHYGLMIDSTLNGVKFAFGNKVKATTFYGKERNADIYGNQYTSAAAQKANKYEVTGLTLQTATSKVTNLVGGYYEVEDTDAHADAKVWEAGFDTKLNADWSLKAAYGQSDADVEDTAYFAQIGYKGANKTKVGSYGAWANYRHLEANAAPRTTFDNAYANAGKMVNGGKGFEVGFNYTPVANTVMMVKYSDIKSLTPASLDLQTQHLRAQVEFFF